METALEILQKFEKQADVSIAKISLWKHPIRSILSLIYLSADGQYVGTRFARNGQRDDDVGTAMITRMSYVTKFFGRCSHQIGADIDDALSVVDSQFQSDIEQLLGYAHFCEIMPLVRRGFFNVERQPSAFLLSHPNEEYVKHEEYDILMSEMVLPHDLVPPPYPLNDCVRMVKAWPNLPSDALINVLKGAFDHYTANVFELPLLSEDAFRDCFGFSRQDFVRMRSALMAYADFCLGMADAAELLAARAFTRFRRTNMQRETREWAAPLLNRNHVIGMAAGVSTVKPDVAERIVDLFTISMDNVASAGAGEGFFPPFMKLGDALLFSPHAVKRLMPERNLIYKVVKSDTKKFDNVVSSHLEPALLDDAARLISSLPGVEIRKNLNWANGEIDILAYHQASNSALQLQAKASVPPQGARMVAQVESRTLEAVEQIERFLAISLEEKDMICSSAIGRGVSAVIWSSGVLMRTCLGTERAWNSIAGHVPLNPILLRAAIKRMTAGGEFSFMNLGKAVDEELTQLRSSAVRGWENKSFTLFGETIRLPLLNLDYTAISKFRMDAAG
jgi:hypothetical protein